MQTDRQTYTLKDRQTEGAGLGATNTQYRFKQKCLALCQQCMLTSPPSTPHRAGHFASRQPSSLLGRFSLWGSYYAITPVNRIHSTEFENMVSWRSDIISARMYLLQFSSLRNTPPSRSPFKDEQTKSVSIASECSFVLFSDSFTSRGCRLSPGELHLPTVR